MKQRSSKKSIPKEARYPSSLSAAEAERDLQDIQNLIDAAASKKTHERAARIR
jgi:hypothetical protein